MMQVKFSEYFVAAASLMCVFPEHEHGPAGIHAESIEQPIECYTEHVRCAPAFCYICASSSITPTRTSILQADMDKNTLCVAIPSLASSLPGSFSNARLHVRHSPARYSLASAGSSTAAAVMAALTIIVFACLRIGKLSIHSHGLGLF
jgi:hypothetical protein